MTTTNWFDGDVDITMLTTNMHALHIFWFQASEYTESDLYGKWEVSQQGSTNLNQSYSRDAIDTLMKWNVSGGFRRY